MKKYLVILLSFLLVFGCSKPEDGKGGKYSDLVPIELKEGNNTAGYVLYTDGSPVAGVVVSDGYSCTITDKNGIYQFARNSKARNVFISYPENCEISCKTNQIPDFFHRITPGTTDEIRNDFQLKKISGIAPSSFILYLIADSQVKTPVQEKRFVNEVIADLNAHVAKQTKPCIVVTLGDDGDDNLYHVSRSETTTTYQSVSNCYGYLNLPCFHCIGNHDHDKTVPSGDADYYVKSLGAYEAAFNPVNYSFNYGNVHFVIMDDIKYTGPSTYELGLKEEQIEWLKQDLSYVPTGKCVYVCMHGGIRGSNFSCKDELMNLIAPYADKRIFIGHSHYNQHYIHTKYGNTHEWIVSAACGLFWRGTIANDGSPLGYGVCHVGRNGVENSYYKSVNYEDGFQGRILDASDFSGWKTAKDGDGVLWTDKVVCNIWNSDSQNYYKWTVELYEDGKRTKPMSMSKTQDYSVYDWIDRYTDLAAISYPHNSMIWKAVPVSRNSVKSVKAVDSHGNEYWITETVKDCAKYRQY